MIRRFNYTDRLRISRADIHIVLREQDGTLEFDADLDSLVDYNLPADGMVFVEAYRQTNWMRFSFGQVGAIQPDSNRVLSQFDSPAGIHFRVKVTANGDIHTLLAEADGIPLSQPDRSESERTPLLPVKPQKLGEEIYRLDFSDDRPLLLINSEAGNYDAIGRTPAFVSLVYPLVFKEILTRILLIENYEADVTADDWKSHWIRFASEHPGLGEVPDPEQTDERFDWIEKAVTAFAKQLKVRTKFAEFWKEDA